MSNPSRGTIRYFVYKNGVGYLVAPCFDAGSTAPYNFNLKITDTHVIVSLDGQEPEQYPLLKNEHEVAAIIDPMFPNKKGVFIDADSAYYTVSDEIEGGCNAPYHVIVEGRTVLECGAYSYGDGYSIEGEYTLHPSMKAIADLPYPPSR